MLPLDEHIKDQLEQHETELERILNMDFISIISDIHPSLDVIVQDVIEKRVDKRESLAIFLQTPGGIVEVVAWMVNTIRHHYSDVSFLVLDKAMSAGTVFVMSGDRIMMDYFSCLGPIDPQVYKDGRLVPALSYLNQFNRLIEKANLGQLSSAEAILLNKLDLGELHQFQQARDLSIELLKKWLSKYKFKNWTETETRKIPVTPEMKEKRAEEIATALSDDLRWHSHGRPIDKETLENEIRLKIDDLSNIKGLRENLKKYYGLMIDYMYRQQWSNFVHMKGYL